jgi:hypothetical protein
MKDKKSSRNYRKIYPKTDVSFKVLVENAAKNMKKIYDVKNL